MVRPSSDVRKTRDDQAIELDFTVLIQACARIRSHGLVV